MSGLEIALGALLIVFAIIMIIVIILQEGNQQGIGVVTGGADSSSLRTRLVQSTLSFHAGQRLLQLASLFLLLHLTFSCSLQNNHKHYCLNKSIKLTVGYTGGLFFLRMGASV